jgi:DNA-binding NarL/FixJ family response regulator
MTSIAIVEDNRGFRDRLYKFVNDAPGFHCVFACATAEEALEKIPELFPDVVLMDIHLPVVSGVECTRRLRDICPLMRILILTVYEDNEHIFGAMKAGASGYLLKRADPPDILHAIEEVKLGGAPMSRQIASRVVGFFHEPVRDTFKDDKLSAREEEILQALSKGYSNKEISSHLSISVTTVNAHLRNIYEKLHVRSRTQAVSKFLQ